MTRRTSSRNGRHTAADTGKATAKAGSGDARTRILDAAERLFAADGFEGTPTSRIAHDAGVPKGLLFYYFPSKFDLLSSLLGERLGGLTLEAASLIVPGNPVQALLNVSSRLFAARAQSNVLDVIVWREERTHTDVRAALDRHRRALFDTIEQVLTGSLLFTADQRFLHAAATAWAAIVTARPLEGLPGGALHAIDNLRTTAELICTGLRAVADQGAPTPV